MTEQKQILRLIEQKLSRLREEKSAISIVDFDVLINLMQKLYNISNDYKALMYLSKVDLDDLEKFCSNNDIKTLLACQEIIKNDNFDFNENLRNKLNLICKSAHQQINNYRNELLSKSQKMQNINKEMELFSKIKGNINNDYDIESFEKVMNLIKESEISSEEKISLLIYMANSSIKNFDLDVLSVDVSEEKEEDELKITNLEEEDLLILFEQYGYNFDLFNQKAKNKIKKYGNIDNIKAILDELNNQKIDLKWFIEKKSLNLADIFIYSKANLIKMVLDEVKDKNVSFDQLIKIPTCFISKKRNIIKVGSKLGEGGSSETPTGSQEDFINNLRLIEQKYIETYGTYDFNALFDKCSCIFIKPHKNIKKSIKIFEYYNIPPRTYLNTLSSLSSSHMVDIIDLCIELSCFDYLKQNLSKVNLMPDDEQFYMIARARQLGYPDYKIFNSKGLKYKELKEDKNIGVNKTNGAIVTNKYKLDDRLIKLFTQYNDVLFESSKNDEFDFAVINFHFKNLQSNLKLKEFDRLYSDPNNKLIYNINGIIISKNKVLKIYNNLLSRSVSETDELLLFALTYNSIITQEQFDNIYGEIGKIYSNKEKKI